MEFRYIFFGCTRPLSGHQSTEATPSDELGSLKCINNFLYTALFYNNALNNLKMVLLTMTAAIVEALGKIQGRGPATERNIQHGDDNALPERSDDNEGRKVRV